MGKLNYISAIKSHIRGLSGINYQSAVTSILYEYYKFRSIKFEFPSSYGGDYKNDGWVPSEAVFYAIYSPVNFSKSFHRNILDKFNSDLRGLVSNVYGARKLWGGVINQFVFIVNTRDTPLPADPAGEIKKIIKKTEGEFGVKLKCSLVNDLYIFDLLTENYDEIMLQNIAFSLNVTSLIQLYAFDTANLFEVIRGIAETVNNEDRNEEGGSKSDFELIDFELKIEINKLVKNKQRVLNFRKRTYNVEKAVKKFNASLEGQEIFGGAKKNVVDNYLKLSKLYEGDDLYEKIIESFIDPLQPNSVFLSQHIELFIVYIFELCDIFKREQT